MRRITCIHTDRVGSSVLEEWFSNACVFEPLVRSSWTLNAHLEFLLLETPHSHFFNTILFPNIYSHTTPSFFYPLIDLPGSPGSQGTSLKSRY